MFKKNKLLVIYAIIIFVLLIAIMFIIPDSFFKGMYDTIDIPSPTSSNEKREFIDFEIQKDNLLKNKFEYEYLLLDSMGTETYTFKCSGKINDKIESGTCTSPEAFSYTESTKKDAFSKINIDFLNPSYIFNLIKEVEPIETKYPTIRDYNYKTNIKFNEDDLETEIIIHTDLNEITKIEISNAYMTYIIKYNRVNIDN